MPGRVPSGEPELYSAEAEAARVAHDHLVIDHQSPIALSAPAPLVDETPVDESTAHQTPADEPMPEAVSDEPEALAPTIKKRVVRRR